jgi:serine/threonine-protein kinase
MTLSTVGRYEIRGELGRGGMATVFQAYDPRFKRMVALKLLPPQFMADATFRARFEREAQTIAALEHPAIVPVYDYGEQDGQPYLVMRYMPGGSLADRLSQGPLSPQEAAHIIARLASALDQVHQRGIIHRDLKPANVLFDQYGEAYLSDFGIAHLSESTSNLTGDAIVGTPAYMSPEQARGDPVDRRSDLYALGVILFQMLSGRQPYQATTPIAVAMKHITDPVPVISQVRPDLPPVFDPIIEGAMAKAPDRRYATGQDLSTALQRAVQSTGGAPVAAQAAPASRPVPLKPPPPARHAPTTLSASQPSIARAPSQPGMRPAQKPKASLWIFGVGGAGLLALIGLLVIGTIGVVIATAANRRAAATASAAANVQPTLPVDSPTPEGAATEWLAAAPPPQDGVLTTLPFKDDFSDPQGRWSLYAGKDGAAEYQGGSFRIWTDLPNAYLIATPGLAVENILIEVEATKTGGPDRNFFGVVCQVQDRENFYLLAITSDGYYGIYKILQGEWVSLLPDEWAFDETIHQGSTTNNLAAECAYPVLILSVNGYQLAAAKDGDFASGDAGLAAGSKEIQGVTILFDNFLATQP